MPYKMITNVGKLCGRLAGAAFRHRDLVVGSLHDRWRERLPESEDFSGLHLILTLVGEDLYRKHDELVVIENDLLSELQQDRTTRSERDSARVELRQLLIDSKRLIEVFYGPGAVEIFWQDIDVEVPVDPEEVWRVAHRLRHNILNPDFPRPPLQLEIGADLERFAHRFDAPLAILGGSVRTLHQGTQGSNASLAAKERELELEQKQAILAARLLEALTAYAGHEGVARRIRLSRRRRVTSDDDREVSTDTPPTDAAPDVAALDVPASDASASSAAASSAAASDRPGDSEAPSELPSPESPIDERSPTETKRLIQAPTASD